jgi:uncharacterized protein YjbJ (UPF0337 family)
MKAQVPRNPEALHRLIQVNHEFLWGQAMASGTVDKITGAVKEAFGKLTGSRRTEAEGKTDQAKGDLKNATDNVTESAKGVRDSLKKK